MSCTLVLGQWGARPVNPPKFSVSSASLLRRYETPREEKRAVEVEGESIKFNVEKMELGRFYVVELANEPYLIRKVSEEVVDVYGVVEKD